MKRIIGRGGKDEGGASEDPDSLISHDVAVILDLIAEGEIEGFVTGNDTPENIGKSIYLDGVPVVNDDDSYNFSPDKLLIDVRLGTQAQLPFATMNDTENQIGVGAEVTLAAAVVRSITDENVDEVRIRLAFPQLTNIDEEGVHGTEVEFKVELQSDGGGYVTKVNGKVSGKSTSRYVRSYQFKLTGDPPWDIRVSRLTADNHSATLQNQSYWDSLVEVIVAKLSYPNSAMVQVVVDSTQFSSVPVRSYHLKGWRVKVPTNYNPVTRVYTGIWDGTWQIAWTNNPVWNYYFLLQHTRAGLGQFIIEEQIDKWGLYQLAQYCDELVPDGKGGEEPRFTCAVYLQQAEEAYTLLNNLTSIFRGIQYWGSGTVLTVQDAPSDPVQLYTAANVIDGLFNYSGSSAKVRHTVALVTWNNPENSYEQAVEYVEDVDGITRYGVINTEVIAVGCTSQGQANRVGRWILMSERFQTEVVQFSVALDGALCRPGQVIKVADPGRAGVRLGGRVVSADATHVRLDAIVVLEPGVTYTVSVITETAKIEDRTVTASLILLTDVGTDQSFESTQLEVDPPFTDVPTPMAIWVLASDNIEAQLFRVTSVAEAKKNEYQVTALIHNESKYDAVDLGTQLQIPNISIFTSMTAPENPLITESVYRLGATETLEVTISWDKVDEAARYEVIYKIDNDNPVKTIVLNNDLTIRPAKIGHWAVQIAAISSVGRRGPYAYVEEDVTGLGTPPDAITGLALNEDDPDAILTWDPMTDISVTSGGFIVVRFQAVDADTAAWVDADEIARVPGSNTTVTVPLSDGTYLLRSLDLNGQYSDGVSAIEYNAPSSGTMLVSLTTLNTSGTTHSDLCHSGTVTALVSGGTPPYTYAWTLVDNDANSNTPYADTPSSAASRFSATGLSETNAAISHFKCTITDSTPGGGGGPFVDDTADLRVSLRYIPLGDPGQ